MSQQVVFLEQKVLKESADYKGSFITSFPLYIDIYLVKVILIYTSNVLSSVTYIKQVKQFTVNYPADVPPK
jgi:hypothetical protein